MDNPDGRRSQFDPIVPKRGDIDAWRWSAKSAIQFDTVKPGEFNWPMVVLSLIAEWEKNNATG